MGWMVRLFSRASIISDILVETSIGSISAAVSGNDSSSIDKPCE